MESERDREPTRYFQSCWSGAGDDDWSGVDVLPNGTSEVVEDTELSLLEDLLDPRVRSLRRRRRDLEEPRDWVPFLGEVASSPLAPPPPPLVALEAE
jgi:hypothetical protein